MTQRVAFITGVTGQDGGELARLLLVKGYAVHGLARAPQRFDWARLDGVSHARARLVLHAGDMRDTRSLTAALGAAQPDEIYNLAAQSNVGLSFERPEETHEVNAAGVHRLLRAVRLLGLGQKARIYQAASSEMFGTTRGAPCSEETPFNPLSPYARSKVEAFDAVTRYRAAFGGYACNGILFNHEGPHRWKGFVSRKISIAVAAKHLGIEAPLYLGNLNARRDFGHVRDYVTGIWAMLQAREPEDFVLATGEAHSVRDFVEACYAAVGRDVIWEGDGTDETGRDAATGEFLAGVNPRFYRPADPAVAVGDASKAQMQLGWRPRVTFHQLAHEMVIADVERLRILAALGEEAPLLAAVVE
mgnify:CR=1 FL=1